MATTHVHRRGHGGGATPSPPPMVFLLLLALLAAVATALGLAGTAHAASGYKYWNYFHLAHDSWTFAQQGAGDHIPRDGAVEGYRYGVSTSDDGIAPRTDLHTVTFHALCGTTDASAGQKRVGVVIDYGTRADAENGQTPPHPRGACAAVAKDASGQRVLGSVADLRVQKGLTCAIDGYPAQGCGEAVKNAQPTGKEPSVAFDLAGGHGHQQGGARDADAQDGSGFPWLLVGAAVLVVVLGGGATALNRRTGARR